MAINREAQVLIRFKPVGLNTTRRMMERQFGQMSGRASYYAGLIQSRLGYAMVGMASAITAGIATSVKSFADFDQAIMNSVSVMSDGRENMEALRQTALSLGKEMPHTATQIANALYFMGSAGWSAAEAMTAMKTASMLAVATQSDLVGTTRYLMQTLNQFGAGAKEANKFANIMMAGIKNSQLQIQTLGQALENVGPIAHAAGVSFDQVVSHLMALHNAGVRGGKAGRHLRIIYTRLLNPIGRGEKELKKLGLTMEDVTIEEHELTDAMEALRKAGIDTAGMMNIFRQRSGGSALAIMNNSEQVKGFLTLLKDKTALIDTFNTQMEGMRMKFEMLKVALLRVFVPIGAAFAKVITPVIEGLTAFANFLGDRGPLFSALMALGMAFTALNFAIWGVKLIFQGMLTQAQMSLGMFKALITSTLGLAGAEGTLATAQKTRLLTSYYLNERGAKSVKQARTWAKFALANKGHTKALADANIVLARTYLGLTAAQWASVGAFVAWGAIVAAIIVTIVTLVGTATRAGVDIKMAFINMMKGIFTAVTTLGDFIIQAFQKIWDLAFGDFIRWVKEVSKWLYDKLPQGLKNMVDNVGAWMETQGENLKKIPQKLKEAFDVAWAGVVEGTKIAGTAMKEWIMVAVADFNLGKETIINMVMELFNVTREQAKQTVEEVGNAMKDVGDATETYFDQLVAKQAALMEEMHGKFENNRTVMDDYKTNLRTTWSATIMDMIKGAKTWEDVLQEILDRSLENFINGFLNEMMTSWGHGLAKMLFDWESMQMAMGAMAAGGGGGGLFGAILGGIGGLFGFGGGASAAMAGSGSSASVAAGMIGAGGFAKGGIANRPTAGVFGEAGPEALIPLDRMDEFTKSGTQEITIVNVVDPSFVGASIAKDPRVVVNVINQDMIEAGSTRRTVKRTL